MNNAIELSEYLKSNLIKLFDIEASNWRDVLNKELNVTYERNVWNIVKPPKHAKILGKCWVCILKTNEIVTYKTRLVAKGFNKIKVENYEEVFRPVSFSKVRLLFVILPCLLETV